MLEALLLHKDIAEEKQDMENKCIEKAWKRYMIQLLGITFVLYSICRLLMLCSVVGDIDKPLTVSWIFMLIVGMAISLIWKKVAISSPESLPTFFTAVSGFRMLLALATLFGCYIAVSRDNMGPYVIVFMIFYVVGLAHHAMFFAQINNKN